MKMKNTQKSALRDYEAREKQAAYRQAKQLEELRRQQALEIEDLTQKASETITAITKVADRAEIKIIEMKEDIDFLLKIGGKTLKQKFQERKQGSPLEEKTAGGTAPLTNHKRG